MIDFDFDFLRVSELSDAQVLERFVTLVQRGRRVTAALVAHLAEVDERRLHLQAGYGSLFSYCVEAHRMSEDEACRRIDVARLARKYPSLLERLASGQLSLTAAAELKPHLRSENALELLDLASEKSVRQVREALAARFPQPDAVSLIRKLPESRSAARALRGVPSVPAASVNAQSAAQPAARPPSPGGPAVSIALPVPARERARIEPTAHERYRVQFAAGAVLKRKLERAADLMSHRNPQRDLARVVEAALDLLLDQLSKSHGSSARAASPTTQTGRHLNRATKRAVIQRDGERCSYTSDSGRRCEARAFLEYDHRQPSAKGGNSQVENVRLLCRAHNRLAAEREYGRDKIESEIGKRRARSVATRPLRLGDSRQARPWRPRANGASLPHRPDHP
ncbi:MAG TPA: hypothetical protein VG937_10795 [Polyangiaceae bacterium]|nr:hypothetical protein [Polyangiaceae bacterium]